MTAPDVDWPALRAAAVAATSRSYAPYSQFRVGAAGLVDDGTVVVGCNVENASYGLTLCAECGLVSAFVAGGGVPVGTGPDEAPRLVAVAVCDPEGIDLSSCGRCRQLLFEAGGPDLLVNERPMAEWLPGAFGPANLENVAESGDDPGAPAGRGGQAGQGGSAGPRGPAG